MASETAGSFAAAAEAMPDAQALRLDLEQAERRTLRIANIWA